MRSDDGVRAVFFCVCFPLCFPLRLFPTAFVSRREGFLAERGFSQRPQRDRDFLPVGLHPTGRKKSTVKAGADELQGGD